MELSSFKAYDIRGRLGDEITEEFAYHLGKSFARFLAAKLIVLGYDIRLTSESLKNALSEGIRDQGCDVIDIGMVGTELVYFGTSYFKADGGIEVTASHNPADFNGMKLVREKSEPVGIDSGLREIRDMLKESKIDNDLKEVRGEYRKVNLVEPYLDHIFGLVNFVKLKQLKIVMNPGNGAAGPILEAIEQRFLSLKLDVQIIKMNYEPDGNFPNGVPNPMLKENREATVNAVLENQADFGIAWDGDFDRCFFIDERGRFIEGYYIVGLLAKAFLSKFPGEKIVHDTRLTWNTLEIVNGMNGQCISSKSGHAFMKTKMRNENAIYGGEMSAHHYFRDFFYCDSGMIPWLLVVELLMTSGETLGFKVLRMMENYPSPGELNYNIDAPLKCINELRSVYKNSAVEMNELDGLSVEFPDWRFNVRISNTESLLRLNIETRGNYQLLCERRDELHSLIKKYQH